MKLNDMFPSNSPLEPAADHVGKRYKGRILQVVDCSFEKDDGTTDPAIGIKVDGVTEIAKLVKVNKTCAKMLMAAWDVNDTDDWLGRAVVVTTQLYPKFNNYGWIVDPDYDAMAEIAKQKQEAAQQALDDEQLDLFDQAMSK